MYGILSDTAIQQAITSGEIKITPFTPKHLNVTSYDLTLGDEVRVYTTWVSRLRDEMPSDGSELQPQYNFSIDSRQEPKTLAWKFNSETGLVLKPGIGYLLHTRESVFTSKYNPILDGKSSIGRLFIQVHATAGYGDPNFDGQYTLEVIVQHPVRVYPGMRFCQIRFHTISGELGKTYDQVGHYVGDSAKGAVASQAWKQFHDL
jgi:dCTP deaminase